MSGPLQVLYTCEPCGLKDVRVTVRHRKQGEDIRTWMEEVSRRVGNDHASRSPNCHPKTLSNLKIPLEGDGSSGIGVATPDDGRT